MTLSNVKYKLYCFQLKIRLNKNDTVRKSDWKIQDLSAIQQCYAATDAYVS
jgi:ribonuclease D